MLLALRITHNTSGFLVEMTKLAFNKIRVTIYSSDDRFADRFADSESVS